MLKKLLPAVREYKRPSILSALFVALEVVVECIIPLLTATLITNIENGCSLRTIAYYGLGLLALAAISLAFGALSGWQCSVASAGFAKNLRRDLYHKVQDFSFSNVDRFSTSSLVTRLTTDVANIQMAYMMIIRIAVRAPLMLVLSFTMSVSLGGRLALVFAAVIPILGFGLYMIIRHAMPLFRGVFKKYDRLNESVQENIKGMRVVKTFVREDYEKEKFWGAAEELRSDFTRAEKIVALNSPVMQLCIYATMILISYFASRLIVMHTGELGVLTGMITYSMQILMNLMMLSSIFVMLSISITCAKRIVEVLDEQPSIVAPANPIKAIADGSVEFDHVSFSYSMHAEKPALQDIHLRIESGQTVGIIGGTGSGKSSLVQLIARLYDVSEGCVRVGGVDVRAYDLDALRNEVAMVLQKNLLFSGTIRENLAWGDPDATDAEMERICRLSQADEFIKTLPQGYDTFIEQGGTNVSGGQRQRLCIARALLKKPKILILDDSTSAVDTKTDALIRRAFRTEIPDTTKFIIAQRISSISDADVIIVMDNGRIDAIGTHDELLSHNAIYREIHESQTKAGGEQA